jgi:hypothetical protein
MNLLSGWHHHSLALAFVGICNGSKVRAALQANPAWVHAGERRAAARTGAAAQGSGSGSSGSGSAGITDTSIPKAGALPHSRHLPPMIRPEYFVAVHIKSLSLRDEHSLIWQACDQGASAHNIMAYAPL